MKKKLITTPIDLRELDQKLEDKFNQAIRACFQQVKGEVTEDERKNILNELNEDALNEIRACVSQAVKEAVEGERERILENVVQDLDRLNSDWKAKVEWIGSELQRYKDGYSEDLQALHPHSTDDKLSTH